MSHEKDLILRLPIRARYTVDRNTGEIIGRSFESLDFPARAVGEFFLAKFGISYSDLAAPVEDPNQKPARDAGTIGTGSALES